MSKVLIDLEEAKAYVQANYQGDPLIRHMYEVLLDKLPKVEPDANTVCCGECRFWEKAHSSLLGEVMVCTGQGDVKIQKTAKDYCSCGERRNHEA